MVKLSQFIADREETVKSNINPANNYKIMHTTMGEIQKNKDTNYSGVSLSQKGASYHDVRYKTEKGKINIETDGDINICVSGITQSDKDGDYLKTKPINHTDYTFTIKCSPTDQENDTGAINFYNAMTNFHTDIKNMILFLQQNRQVWATNPKITSFYNDTYGEKAKDLTKAGKPRDVPLIIFSIKLQDYPQPESKTPYTRVYDARSSEIVDNKINWKPAMYGGKPVDPSNFKKYMTYKSKVWYMRFSAQVIQSNFGISIDLFVSEIAIEHVPVEHLTATTEVSAAQAAKFLKMKEKEVKPVIVQQDEEEKEKEITATIGNLNIDTKTVDITAYQQLAAQVQPIGGYVPPTSYMLPAQPAILPAAQPAVLPQVIPQQNVGIIPNLPPLQFPQ